MITIAEEGGDDTCILQLADLSIFSNKTHWRDSLNGGYFANLFSVENHLLFKEEVLPDEEV